MSLAQVKHVTWGDDYVTEFDDAEVPLSDTDTEVNWSVPAKPADGRERPAAAKRAPRAPSARPALRVSPLFLPPLEQGASQQGPLLASACAQALLQFMPCQEDMAVQWHTVSVFSGPVGNHT